MKKQFTSSFKKTAILLVVCVFSLAFTSPDKNKGKYAKIKVIQHQQGKVNVYDTLINTEKYPVESYLKGLGINAEKANILEFDKEENSDLYFIKKHSDGDAASTQQYEQNHEVKIEKNIDDQGKVTIRKWVNGEEVPVDTENFESQTHDFETKIDSLQKEGLHIEIIKEIEGEEIEEKEDILRKYNSVKEEREPKAIKRIKIQRDNEISDLNHEESKTKRFVWKTDNEEKVKIIKSDKFAIILQTEGEESANKMMHMDSQIDMTTVIVHYLDEETALNKKEATPVMESKQLKLNKLSFYPNPNQGIFQLAFELPQKAPAQLTIHKGENGGILVHEEQLAKKQQNYNKKIDLTKYGKGLYILTIRQGNKSVTEKILMQ